MAWYRSFSCTLLVHAVILVMFVVTIKVPFGMYRTDVIFLGPILRLQEVSSREALLWASPADADQVVLASDLARRTRAWYQGVQVDKPDLFQNTPALGDERIVRFFGERVELDDQGSVAVEDDIPLVAPMKLRLERP